MMIALAFLTLQTPPSVKDLVLAIHNAYSQCETYRDTGTQTTTYRPVDKQTHLESRRFATVYKRPGKLRFQYSEWNFEHTKQETNVLWATGQRELHEFRPTDNLDPAAYKEWVWLASSLIEGEGKVDHDTLGMIVAGFTGISGGTAFNVPNWLFPKDVGGRDALQEKDLKWLGRAKAAGHTCDLLETKSEGLKMWFDARTHLLIKLVEVTDLGAFTNNATKTTSVETTVYAPVVGVPVSDREFVGPKVGGKG